MTDQPTELEMHRADYQACKDAGFECPGELLSAYNILQGTLAWTEAERESFESIADAYTEELVRLNADNAALREALELFLNNSSVQTNQPVECERAEDIMAEAHPGEALLRARDELRAEVDNQKKLNDSYAKENTRLRAALANSDQPCIYCSLPAEDFTKCERGFPGCAKADDAVGCPHLGAALEVEQLTQRVAELEKHSHEPVDIREVVYEILEGEGIIFGRSYDPDEPNWLTHDSSEPPADLAPAQLIKWFAWWNPKNCNQSGVCRADKLGWCRSLQYRPAIGPSGLPLVSAEGLEFWARFVATGEDGAVWQYSSSPMLPDGVLLVIPDITVMLAPGPSTHARPGDWRLSAMEVQR